MTCLACPPTYLPLPITGSSSSSSSLSSWWWVFSASRAAGGGRWAGATGDPPCFSPPFLTNPLAAGRPTALDVVAVVGGGAAFLLPAAGLLEEAPPPATDPRAGPESITTGRSAQQAPALAPSRCGVPAGLSVAGLDVAEEEGGAPAAPPSLAFFTTFPAGEGAAAAWLP